VEQQGDEGEQARAERGRHRRWSGRVDRRGRPCAGRRPGEHAETCAVRPARSTPAPSAGSPGGARHQRLPGATGRVPVAPRAQAILRRMRPDDAPGVARAHGGAGGADRPWAGHTAVRIAQDIGATSRVPARERSGSCSSRT
jgi:hypothetical protein